MGREGIKGYRQGMGGRSEVRRGHISVLGAMSAGGPGKSPVVHWQLDP